MNTMLGDRSRKWAVKTLPWVGCLLLCVPQLAGAAPADPAEFSLTSEEKIWLASHPEIRIAVMADWPPLDYVDPLGKPSGIGVDFLNEVNKLIGGQLRIEAAPFDQSLWKVQEHELDGLMDATPKPDREEYLSFSQPYLTIPHVIVGRRSGHYFESAASMAGRTVALERGFGNVKWFQDNRPDVAIRLYDSTSDALDAVARSEVDAYAGNRAVALFLIEREMLTNLHLQGRVEKPPTVLCLGIRKDWPLAASLLNRALAAVIRRDSRFILSKWFDVASHASGRVQLSGEDRAWLEAHSKIRIGVMDNWPPMDFLDETGTARGIGVDFIGLMNEQLGGRLQVVPGPFAEILEEAKAGKLDALMDITHRLDREEFFSFTKPYVSIPHAIIARKGEAYFDSFASLGGRTVAVETGFFVASHIRSNHPGIGVAEYPSTRDALVAVSEGKADAYVGNRAVATWLMARELLGNLEIQGTPRETASVNAIGVRKDLPELDTILNQALSALPQEDVQEIYARWGGLGQNRSADLTWMRLTPGEKQWISLHPVVRVGIHRRRAPVEFIGPDGKAAGIAKEYLDRFGQTLGIEFNYVPVDSWDEGRDKLRQEEVDLLCYLPAADAGTDDFEFSPPYLTLQMAIFTRDETPYVGQVSELKGFRVSVSPSYALQDFLRKECPDIQLTALADDAPAKLKLLESKQVDALVGSLLINSHYIQKEGHIRIKVAGESRYVYEPAFTCRGEWMVFTSILGKALEDIDENERAALARKWTSVTFEQRVDYALVLKIGAGVGVLMLLFLYWNRRMAAEIRRRKAVEESLLKSEEALTGANQELEAFSYSVSHDLRAPLRHIAGFVQLFQAKAKDKLDETGDRYLTVIAEAAKKMGVLIDDLLSFSRTGRAQMKLETVPLGPLVEECRRDLETDTKGRAIEWKIGALPTVVADRALLRQVMANLIGNAVKYSGKREKAVIEISARREKDEIVVCVRDNGAGFDMKYADKLFGVFQRLHTEAEFEGTGIGLANVRRIVVRHGGRTWAEGEVDQGAAFYFSLPVRQAKKEDPDER